MKYASVIACIITAVGGAIGGYYYGKKKTTAEYEADIASVKEEYQKKIQEAKQSGRMEAIQSLEDGPEDDDKQKLAPNGDIDEEWVEVVKEEEADNRMTEDVVYFASDNVWYNQDVDKTYTNSEPFDIPKDMFSYFGENKADLIYLHNTKTDKWYVVRFNPGSYVELVLGYKTPSSNGGEEK